MLYYVLVAPFVIIILYMILFVTFKLLGFRNIPYEMFMSSPILLEDDKVIATKSELFKNYLLLDYIIMHILLLTTHNYLIDESISSLL